MANLRSDAMLGKRMVTHQTGLAGKVCSRLYIEAGTDIAKELYFSFLVDQQPLINLTAWLICEASSPSAKAIFRA
jgi:succinyl-CoA synthetase beta subunit